MPRQLAGEQQAKPARSPGDQGNLAGDPRSLQPL
jgi:hypothetical protein